MGWEHWATVLEAFVMAAIGVVIRDIKDDIQQANKELKSIHDTYQRKDDLDKTIDRIFIVLDRIENKLDGKADKRA